MIVPTAIGVISEACAGRYAVDPLKNATLR
jgi:hypothetical protein